PPPLAAAAAPRRPRAGGQTPRRPPRPPPPMTIIRSGAVTPAPPLPAGLRRAYARRSCSDELGGPRDDARAVAAEDVAGRLDHLAVRVVGDAVDEQQRSTDPQTERSGVVGIGRDRLHPPHCADGSGSAQQLAPPAREVA